MPNLPPHALSHGPLGGDPVGPFDPANGVYVYDDMNWGTTPDSRYLTGSPSGGGTVQPYTLAGVNGIYDPSHRAQGTVEIASAAGQGGPAGGACCRGAMGVVSGGTSLNGYQLGYGPCTLKSRIALGNGNQQKGNSSTARFGFFQQTGAMQGGLVNVTTAIGALFLEYSPDNNGGNLRLAYTSGGSIGNLVSFTYINCTNAVPNFGQFEWWELELDASLNVTALLNGNIIGSGGSIAPGNLAMLPYWSMWRGTIFGTLCYMTIDDLYLYYPYNRR
jgi:hypothetical protein